MLIYTYIPRNLSLDCELKKYKNNTNAEKVLEIKAQKRGRVSNNCSKGDHKTYHHFIIREEILYSFDEISTVFSTFR